MNNTKRTKRTARRLLVQSLEDRRLLAAGPYAPAAGQTGSTAVSVNDPAIIAWASTVTDYSPGTNVDARWQDPSQAIGKAEGVFDRVVSLGRGGTLTLGFDTPIRDGLGPDFVVFENAINDTFLELGFVEVSSDGLNFVRFASDSRTAAPVASFGDVDPTNLNNLAGKYRVGFGTPLDLGELRGRPGLDVTAVTHVRLVDIIGDGSVRDASGDSIYDPTPTFQSAGLDVDGVGVIHQIASGEVVIDFETLGAGFGDRTFDNGSGATNGFRESEIILNNDYSTQYQSWSGWAISKSTDSITPGYTNQYGNTTGGGLQGSDTFAVGFFDVSPSGALPPPSITLDPTSGSRFDSLYVTNTTYAALSMRDGDSFAKKYGGTSGNDPDFLRLTVTGLNAAGDSVGSVNVMLADFRFDDSSQDVILDAWTHVDVSSLASARSLQFSVAGSDVGSFGLNTPAYFAVDNVTLRRAAIPFDLATPRTRENEPVVARVSRPTADMSAPITVTLQSQNNSAATAPAIVTIAANTPYAEFTIVPANDSIPSADRTFEITASAANLLASSRTLTIEDDERLAIAFTASIVNATEGSGIGGAMLTLTRNDADVSQPLAVTLTRQATTLLEVPTSVSFAANERQLVIPLDLLDDTLFTGGDNVLVTATAVGRPSATVRVAIADNDLPAIRLQPGRIVLNENDPLTTRVLTVARNTDDLTNEITIALTLPDGGPLSIPAEVTIPAGVESVAVSVSVIADALVNALPAYRIHASNTNMISATMVVEVTDQPRLRITAPNQAIDESDAMTLGDFEELGKQLIRGEFDNDASNDASGDASNGDDNPTAFVSGPFSLSNSFDNSYGFDLWSRFAISRGDDTVTPGFGNQFSAITGIGSGGSSTYAVAYVSSSATISRSLTSTAFASIDVTNTTYAALSMRDGDPFAKKFGGESGNDPDFLLLTIDGLDAAGDSIGRVEFYLADYRFEDSTLDHIVDQWTTIDVSSIGTAQTLSMSMTSSDNGQWGMNTPAYFAIDNLTLAPDAGSLPTITIERSGEDTSASLVVELSGNRDEVSLPTRVTIPAGETNLSVPVGWVNNHVVDGSRTWEVNASAEGFSGAVAAISLVDDDVAELTLTLSEQEIDESDGVQTVHFEDVGETLSEQSYNKGENRRGGFGSGSLFFPTDYNPTWGSWSGWAASNMTDVTTPGFSNQFSAYASDSNTFAIAGGYGATPPTIALPESMSGAAFESIAITNTTYAALSMLQGDSFAKKFGGETGVDPDYFLLTIEGINAAGDSVGTVDFYLADYRSEESTLDYLVDDWTRVDLSSLVGATSLQFGLSSSDVGSFGMNTPAYFAIDDLVIAGVKTSPSLVIHRNTADLNDALAVSLTSSDPARVSVAAPIVIPAGAASVRVPLAITNDAVFDINQSIRVAATAPGLPDSEVSIRLVEDERPGILIDPSLNNLPIVEGGAAGVFTVALQSPPTDGPLIVSIQSLVSGSDPADRLHMAPTSLTFTADNWQQPQTVSVAGWIDLIAQAVSVIGLRLSADGGVFAPSTAWVELADYQPSELTLRNEDAVVRLVDDLRNFVFGEYTTDQAIEIALSNAAQQITLQPRGTNTGATVDLGGGNDKAIMNTRTMTRLDGGAGDDTVVIAPSDLAMNETIDIAEWLSSRVVHFETIVLGSDNLSGDVSANRFAMDAVELNRLFGDSVPRIITSARQPIDWVGQWQFNQATIENANVIAHLTSGAVKIEVITDRPWRNTLLAADVNGNGDVTSVDALAVINRLNANSSSTLPMPQTEADLPTIFYDVSGDGMVTSLDALQVINFLNDYRVPDNPTQPDGEPIPVSLPLLGGENAGPRIDVSKTQGTAETLPREPQKVVRTDFASGQRVSLPSAEWLNGRIDLHAARKSHFDAVDAALADSDWLSPLASITQSVSLSGRRR